MQPRTPRSGPSPRASAMPFRRRRGGTTSTRSGPPGCPWTTSPRWGRPPAVAPPAVIVNELVRRLLVAEGSEWWGRGSTPDGGKAFARSVSDGVKGEFAKIRAPKDQLIVLTNRHATIPLALTSGTTYKVWVKVGLESDKLAFKDGVP